MLQVPRYVSLMYMNKDINFCQNIKSKHGNDECQLKISKHFSSSPFFMLAYNSTVALCLTGMHDKLIDSNTTPHRHLTNRLKNHYVLKKGKEGMFSEILLPSLSRHSPTKHTCSWRGTYYNTANQIPYLNIKYITCFHMDHCQKWLALFL